MTVRGPLEAERIGFTLPHEHLSCDPSRRHLRQQAYDYDPDLQLIVDELDAYRSVGGSCVVDLTTPGLGRDERWLARLADASDMHIVMAAGWYRQSFFPPDAAIEQRSADELAEELIAEIVDGLPGSGIRPGIVGEIGADDISITPGEERVHRAAARAAGSTGLSLVTHSLRSRVALEQVRIFDEEGLDPARVVIGHADTTPDLSYLLELLRHGVHLCFDQLGLTEAALVGQDHASRLLADLLAKGYADRLLLSHDICTNAQLRANGGHGFTYLLETFIPALRRIGIGEPEVLQMTTLNPRRLLGVTRT